MQYDVYSPSGNIIGHVEADNPVEAWAKAREIYQATGSMVFDVRPTTQTEQKQKEIPEGVRDALERSMREEDMAVTLYNSRAKYARLNGDEISARLWEHIAEEENGHYNEFKDRLGSL